MSALQLAVSGNHSECVVRLLREGASVDVTDVKGNNAMQTAAIYTSDSITLKVYSHSNSSYCSLLFPMGDQCNYLH